MTDINHNESVIQIQKLLEQLLVKVENLEKKFNISSQFLTIEEAAAYLKKSKHTLYGYASNGEIKFKKSGNRLLFDIVDLDEFINTFD